MIQGSVGFKGKAWVGGMISVDLGDRLTNAGSSLMGINMSSSSISKCPKDSVSISVGLEGEAAVGIFIAEYKITGKIGSCTIPGKCEWDFDKSDASGRIGLSSGGAEVSLTGAVTGSYTFVYDN